MNTAKRLLGILCVLLYFVGAVYSQSGGLNNQPIDPAFASAIEDRVVKGDYQAIYDLADTHSTNAIPQLLTFIIPQDQTDDPRALTVGCALVRMGAELRLDTMIFQATKSLGDDVADRKREHFFRVLAFTKSKASVRILFKYLDDKSDNPHYSMHSNNAPAAFMALCNMGIAGAPKTEYKMYGAQPEYVQAWRSWWVSNKARYIGNGPLPAPK